MHSKPTRPISSADITALVLCGGKSTRMSGVDKGLIELDGKPMIAHTLEQLSPFFARLIISANQNTSQYGELGYEVIQDETSDVGPLAGILTAMRYVSTDYLLVSPCDTPLITREFSQRLIETASQPAGQASAEIYVAHDGKHLQMLHALFDLSSGKLVESLENYLKNDRKVQIWYEQNQFIPVDCSDIAQHFVNINTPESLIEITDN